MNIEKKLLRKIIEGALLAAGQPLSIAKLQTLFVDDSLLTKASAKVEDKDSEQEGSDAEVKAPQGENVPDKEEMLAALEDIQADCRDRGFELKEVASGWRFHVCEDVAPWVNRLWEEKPQKYSRALLETLSLIAYRQPITRGDIEDIRGVAVSSHIIRTLVEREWVKVVGHRDVPGRPSLYASTRQFLDYFNLKSLEDLPSLGDIRDLDELNKELDLGLDEQMLAAAKNAEVAAKSDALESEEDAAVEESAAENLEAEDSSVEDTTGENLEVENTETLTAEDSDSDEPAPEDSVEDNSMTDDSTTDDVVSNDSADEDGADNTAKQLADTESSDTEEDNLIEEPRDA